jgi:hypothetical protein
MKHLLPNKLIIAIQYNLYLIQSTKLECGIDDIVCGIFAISIFDVLDFVTREFPLEILYDLLEGFVIGVIIHVDDVVVGVILLENGFDVLVVTAVFGVVSADYRQT